MLRHILLLIYRNFKRSKSTFLINLVGLSTGLASVLLIFLWVNDELSIDKFHENNARLYQVMKTNTVPQGIQTGEDTPGLLAESLAEEMPEVERAVSVFPPAAQTFAGILSVDGSHSKASSKYADKDFFTIFSYPIIHGNSEEVLENKHHVAISEKLAKNLFSSPEDAIGKTVEWKGEMLNGQFMVSGVFKDLPSNASIKFDIVISYDLLLETFPKFLHWRNSRSSTYVLLQEDANIMEFNEKIRNFVRSKYEESNLTLFSRPYSDRYLYSDYEDGVLVGGRIDYINLFSIIAIFILLIACINFMNLSTAKATGRIKEVGIKKAIGAGRKILIFQYMGESLLMSVVSLILALILSVLFLPQFNLLTGKNLAIGFSPTLIITGLILTLITGIIAGSYPAFYLSGFNPLAVLKGRFERPIGELAARKGLVISQFVLSVVLIIAVIVVSRQIEYVQAKNLGFSKNNVIRISVDGKVAEAPETFLSEIKKIPGIVNASFMDGDLVGLHSGTTDLDWEGKLPDQTVDFELLGIGFDLIETLGIDMAEGRSFNRQFGAESSKLIFNEAAIEIMGITNPVGKTVNLWGEDRQIVGVVKNFHFESLYEEVNPLFFRLLPKANNILIKMKAGTEQEALALLEDYHREYNAGLPLEYNFLDEDFQRLYLAETQVAALSRYAAGLTILISCLGLFGLSAYTAERRVKEIGIRKVLGASLWRITKLLSGDFAKMVGFSIVIALPLSYFMTMNWLENFAYKIDLEWWYFIGAGALTMLIALLTVSFQSVKAALVNPVDSLRSE